MKKPDFYCINFIQCQNHIHPPADCKEQCNSCMDEIIDHHFNNKKHLYECPHCMKTTAEVIDRNIKSKSYTGELVILDRLKCNECGFKWCE